MNYVIGKKNTILWGEFHIQIAYVFRESNVLAEDLTKLAIGIQRTDFFSKIHQGFFFWLPRKIRGLLLFLTLYPSSLFSPNRI